LIAPSAWPPPVKRVVFGAATTVTILAYLGMCAGLAGLSSAIIATIH